MHQINVTLSSIVYAFINLYLGSLFKYTITANFRGWPVQDNLSCVVSVAVCIHVILTCITLFTHCKYPITNYAEQDAQYAM